MINSFFKYLFFLILIFFLAIILLTKEYPFECKPLEGTAKIKSLFFILFFFSILLSSTSPTAKPAISNLPFSYVPGISAVSPPTNSQLDILQPLTIPFIIDFNFDKLILFIEI